MTKGSRWTRELPTKVGWYWFRDGDESPAPVHVFKRYDCHRDEHRLVGRDEMGNVYEIAVYDTGEWQGPIEPEE